MKHDARRGLLIAIFFVSGFTGLIYESLWSHYLKLFLGHAAYAQSLVLVIFMGGMAAGAAIAGRLSARLRNLLAGYALAEIGIGCLALVFHPLFKLIVDLSLGSVMPGMSHPAAIEAYKWGVALLLLLPPSVLLGTTFPLMSGAILRRYPGQDGGNLAILYFSNSFGAALGVLAASFFLIGSLGLPGTLVLAGMVNLLIGVSVFLLSRHPEMPPLRAAAFADGRDRNLLQLFLVAAFVTGAASFIYEVNWIRMLSLVLGSTFHAFELMLSAFITGLALGSLAIKRHIDRIRNPLALAAAIQLAMGTLAVLTLPIYGLSFDWMGALVRNLARDDQGYLLFNLASHGIAFAVMLPATFMAGMTLPLFTHVLIREGHGERSIGLIYSANTLGGIAGVLFAVHVGLPAIGLKLSLASGALLDIALGLALLRRAGATPRLWLGGLAALLVLMLAVRFVALDGALLSSGVYRTGKPQIENATTLFYQDGKTSSISVTKTHSTVAIRTNGKPDAAIEMNPSLPANADEITMVMAAAVPMAIRPDARKVANIGFGSGLTSHTVLANPNIAELSTIEIERAVVDGARAFLPRVRRAYDDPRSKIYIEDAKSWFARHNQTFDIIISEPSNPWVSGVASLFSDEFYQRIKGYLDERGLLVQWINLYEFNTPLAASVILALNRHFPDYAVYLTDDSNILIVAVKSGTVPALTADIFRQGELSGDLRRVGINGLDDIALRRLGSAEMISPMLRALGAPINSDFHPHVELNAPKARFLRTDAREFPLLGIYPLPLIEMLDRSVPAWEAGNLTPVGSWRYAKVAGALSASAGLRNLPISDAARVDQVKAWKAQLRDCDTQNDDTALSALHEIALNTLAFLDRKSLQALWHNPSWLSCTSANIRSRLRVYQAVAARDAPAMLAAAESALVQPGETTVWRRYALDVGLIAARRMADEEAVGRLWKVHGRHLYADGSMSAELVLLLSHGAEPD